jgi:HEAT repeat protein
MEQVINFIVGLDWWVYAVAGAVVAIVLALILVVGIRRRRFRNRVLRFLETPGRKDPSDYFTTEELLGRTRVIERLAEQHGAHVVSELGVDLLWTERLQQKERKRDFQRVLRFAPGRGLFACFLVSLRNPRLAERLKSYLREHSDFLVLRNLALSGRGEEFNGADAREFFSDRLDEVREMTGDPEWPSRYFAVKVLLYDHEERSTRAMWDSFADPHALVRKTVATELISEDSDRLYELVHDLFLHDPVFEVREAARARIRADFEERYELDAKKLEPEEAVHVVELLDPESDEDQSAAVELLVGDDLELRLAAARFLDRSGRLRRLFTQSDLADEEELDRNFDILHKAAGVHVAGFLSAIRESVSPSSLLMAARLLQEGGPPELISDLAERVFRVSRGETSSYLDLYEQTVVCIRERGEQRALELLAREIERVSHDEELLPIALSGVPMGSDSVFARLMIRLLEDPETVAREQLRVALRRLDTSRVLTEALKIITGGRQQYPHRVRIDALLLLGELELPYALQDILEHLPILPLEEAREFAALLEKQQPKDLERKTKMLLESVDGGIRASLIAALPATGKKTFLNDIKKALGDADPDVRIAATWSLVEYDETRALTQAAEMLRDPLERVRINVARAVGRSGGKAALDQLKNTLFDENEVEAVKRAAIEGLAAAQTANATDMLVDKLEEDSELQEEVTSGLSKATDGKCMKRLIERFKDGSPALRTAITQVFKLMGEHSEEAIREVLEEDIPSLRPFLNEILEGTGYVESRIRMLKHRDPKVRRDAATFLSSVGTASAFRGIVLAARDPDEEVRARVTKALERLATSEGEEILHALEEDPERRIRKYTAWALERIKAKKL